MKYSILAALSDNIEGNSSSSLINLFPYLADCCEDEFVSAAGDSDLLFSSSISTIETISMMNDAGINILQLRILLRILRHEIDTKLFEYESKIADSCGKMIVPQFVEYKYFHAIGSKPELILYWVRDSVVIFKKEITLFINSNQIKINEISRIDVIVDGDHDQGDFLDYR